MTDKKPNAWAVQFNVDDDWFTQTWHKDKKDAQDEMKFEEYLHGIPYRIIETYYPWPK